MKHKNLEYLTQMGFRVPKFVTVRSPEEFDGSFSSGELFAVRSSFSIEDREDASFAGQFDTFLNVSREDVKEKIGLVLSCNQKKTVASYKSARQITVQEEGCVIVQEMVDADCAGVMFTANPLGILNEIVVVVGEGLGDQVVDDRIGTTSYFYHVDDDIYYCERQGASYLLEEEILRELVEQAKKIQELYGRPMDIEYAVKDGCVYTLQARPITTLSLKDQIVLDNSNIVESYPGVSLPLTQEFVKDVYYGIFKNCVRRITGSQELTERLDSCLRDMTDIANWRIYYRISNWYAVLHLLPFCRKIIPMWQRMLGVNHAAVTLPPDFSVSIQTKCKVFHSFFHYLRKIPRLMDTLNQGFEKQYHAYVRQIAASRSVQQLLHIYGVIREDVLKDWDLTLINDMYAFIYTALAGKRNKALISDIKNLESMKPVESIEKLAELVRQQGICSQAYRQAARKHIEQYGDRCLSELKLETKTYRTNPELLDSYVQKQAIQKPPKVSMPACASRNPFVKRAKLGIRNREISRMNRSRLYGMARSIFLKIGQILTEENRLECREDVFYLYIHELNSPQNFRPLVEKRKQEKTFYEKVPAYSRLVFDGKIIDKTGQISHTEILNKQNTLWGIGTSMGKVQGEVLVIEEPKDTEDTTGKILVTKSTDPGWVFLIQNAVGIIAEKGSLLSHTAIISRELHKPAVVNVKDCTAILRTGDIVTLDAETGVVTVERRENEAGMSE